MKLLTRFREEFTPQSLNAEINRSEANKAKATKAKTSSKSVLSRLPQETAAILPTLKVSLR